MIIGWKTVEKKIASYVYRTKVSVYHHLVAVFTFYQPPLAKDLKDVNILMIKCAIYPSWINYIRENAGYF